MESDFRLFNSYWQEWQQNWPDGVYSVHVFALFRQWEWSTVKWFSCNESMKDSIRLVLSYREKSFLQTNPREKQTYSSKTIKSFWILLQYFKKPSLHSQSKYSIFSSPKNVPSKWDKCKSKVFIDCNLNCREKKIPLHKKAACEWVELTQVHEFYVFLQLWLENISPQ